MRASWRPGMFAMCAEEQGADQPTDDPAAGKELNPSLPWAPAGSLVSAGLR